MATMLVNERGSAQYTGYLYDHTDTVIASASISTAKIWVTDEKTKRIVNSREGQNILNANNVTIHATSGLLTWVLQPADCTIEDDRQQSERKHVLIEIVYSSGTLPHRFDYVVRNLRLRP